MWNRKCPVKQNNQKTATTSNASQSPKRTKLLRRNDLVG
jgi:hypothetical protein